MWDSTKAEIAFELQHLKQLLDSFRPLLAKASTGEPDLVETAALGVVLHSFYGGAENVVRLPSRVGKDAQLVFGIGDTLRQLETELGAFLAQVGD